MTQEMWNVAKVLFWACIVSLGCLELKFIHDALELIGPMCCRLFG